MCMHGVQGEVPQARDGSLHECFVAQNEADLHDADSRVSRIHMQIPARQHEPSEEQPGGSDTGE